MPVKTATVVDDSPVFSTTRHNQSWPVLNKAYPHTAYYYLSGKLLGLRTNPSDNAGAVVWDYCHACSKSIWRCRCADGPTPPRSVQFFLERALDITGPANPAVTERVTSPADVHALGVGEAKDLQAPEQAPVRPVRRLKRIRRPNTPDRGYKPSTASTGRETSKPAGQQVNETRALPSMSSIDQAAEDAATDLTSRVLGRLGRKGKRS